MTNKTGLAILFFGILVISLINFTSAFDSGWQNFRSNGNYVVCGDRYPSCNLGTLGLDWFSQNTGNNYQMICGELPGKSGSDCLIWNGAGMGRYYNTPTSGNYYLYIKSVYEAGSSGNDETMVGGITSNWGTSGRNIADLGSGDKSCVFRNTFSITNQNKVWLQGTGGSLNPYQFRLATCVPYESDLVYCDDGQPAIPPCPTECTPGESEIRGTGVSDIGICEYGLDERSCNADYTWGSWTSRYDPILPTTEIPNNGIDEDCNGSDLIVTSAPTVTLHDPTSQIYNTTNILINATANQVITQWSYTINGSAEYVLAPGLIYQFADNTCYDLEVIGRNGNGADSDSTVFCINTSTQNSTDPTPAPVVYVHSPINNTTYNTTLIFLNTTSNQTIDTWLIRINQGSPTVFVPESYMIFGDGCWNVIFYGENANGIGQETVNFCVNTTNSTNPNNDTNHTDPNNTTYGSGFSGGCDDEDDEDVNPYDVIDRVSDLVLGRNNSEPIILGRETENESEFNIYPLLVGLLILGIIVALILILLVNSKEEKSEVTYQKEGFY